MEKLIKNMIGRGVLKTDRIIRAFLNVDRMKFVPADQCENAYIDYPLPIGFNQTISQPSTVAFVLETLAPALGDKILDLGSGSGWQTALLCELVGEKGEIYAVEIIPELKELGGKNVLKYGYKNAKFFLAGEKLGLPQFAPFDKIVAAASAKEPPVKLLEQLKVGGTAVLPVKESIFKYERLNKKNFSSKEFPGFVFVPLV